MGGQLALFRTATLALSSLWVVGAFSAELPSTPYTFSKKSDLEARFSVLLINKSGGGCSAVLVAPDILLTNAHCVGGPAESFEAIFALQSTDPKAKTRQTSAAAVHPLYKPRKNNDATEFFRFDVALVKLSTPAPAPYEPINFQFTGLITGDTYDILQGPNRIYSRDQMFHSSGFGGTEGEEALKVLAIDAPLPKFESTNLNSAGRLKRRFFSSARVKGTILFKSPNRLKRESGGCQGDSGGPIWVIGQQGKPFLVAINAWGFSDDQCWSGQGVWLAGHYDWIAEQSQRLGSKAPIPPRLNNPAGCVTDETRSTVATGLLRIDFAVKNSCGRPVSCLFQAFAAVPAEGKALIKHSTAELTVQPGATGRETVFRGSYPAADGTTVEQVRSLVCA